MNKKNKKNKKGKKKIIIALAAIGVAAAVGVSVLWPVLTRGSNTNVMMGITRTATVRRGTIETTVVGSGSLASDSVVDIVIPSGIVMEDVFVSENDTVAVGEVLATIDAASLQNAIETVLADLADVDKAIEKAVGDTANATIDANVNGRVKQIFAAEGDDVQNVITSHGALLILSVDGKMKVAFQSDSLGELVAGDKVTVTLADGTAKTGAVQSITDASCVVTLTDNGPEVGENVTVSATDGAVLGSGTLEINAPIRVLGSRGTIKDVKVNLNKSVSSGATLFTLCETASSDSYRAQIAKQEELENLLQILLAYSQTNSITAPSSGMISAINVTTGGSSSGLNMAGEENSGSFASTANTHYTGEVAADNGISLTVIAVSSNSTNVTLLAADNSGGDDIQTQVLGGEIRIDIDVPQTGGTPQNAVMTGNGYAGSFIWSPAATIFEEKTVYSAAVTLTADEGYSFDVSATPAVAGGQIDAASIANTGDTLSFTVVFAATSALSGGQPQRTAQTSSPSGGSVSSSAAVDTSSDSESITLKTAFSIKTGEKIILTANVDELDILSLQAGQPASIVLDALPGQTLEGEVIHISDAGTSQSGVTTYPVTMLVRVPEDMTVKLGMNGSATIVTGSSENALIIPMSALQEMNGEAFVMIASVQENGTGNGNAQESGNMPFGERRAVTTGLSDGNNVEILSGLEEGETITYFEIIDSGSSQQQGNEGFGRFPGGGNGGFPGGGGGFPGGGEGAPPRQ